jgi:hypothetical protein
VRRQRVSAAAVIGARTRKKTRGFPHSPPARAPAARTSRLRHRCSPPEKETRPPRAILLPQVQKQATRQASRAPRAATRGAAAPSARRRTGHISRPLRRPPAARRAASRRAERPSFHLVPPSRVAAPARRAACRGQRSPNRAPLKLFFLLEDRFEFLGGNARDGKKQQKGISALQMASSSPSDHGRGEGAPAGEGAGSSGINLSPRQSPRLGRDRAQLERCFPVLSSADLDLLAGMQDQSGRGVVVKDRKYRLRTYKRCFVASDVCLGFDPFFGLFVAPSRFPSPCRHCHSNLHSPFPFSYLSPCFL